MTGVPPRRVPLRRSLLIRLLLVSLLIALVSIGATAWLAVTSTTRALQQEQSHVLGDQAQAYDDLVGYAATHRNWSGVRPLLQDIAGRTGWTLTLTTPEREQIVSTRSGPSPAQQPTAVVDPLNVTPSLDPTVTAGAIDHRAVGPYRLTQVEQDLLTQMAKQVVSCVAAMEAKRVDDIARSVTDETGRPRLEFTVPLRPKVYQTCVQPELTAPTLTQWKRLDRLNLAVIRCMQQRGLTPVKVADLSFRPLTEGFGDESLAAKTCIDRSRRAQLKGFVAPAALLFISSPPAQPSRISLSPDNIRRIVLVTSLVLALTMLLTTMAGLRLVRPLRALIRTVGEPDGTARARVMSKDEIGSLASAFNDLSERRERLESQRKAMISDIAHELRTPLSNVRGWLQAAEDNITARDQALTASLLEEALHLQRIIDDLQDLAQADAGELTLQPQHVDLAEFVSLITHTHRGAADLAGVRLSSDVGAGAAIHADPTRLRQVIGNLVSNALRYTPAGGSVTISVQAADDVVRITVTDTGTGISTDDLPQVFDRFWRAERSRTRATGGSGLGLAIARQLARAHGGDLTVTSDPGRGTTFTITLPRVSSTAT